MERSLTDVLSPLSCEDRNTIYDALINAVWLGCLVMGLIVVGLDYFVGHLLY